LKSGILSSPSSAYSSLSFSAVSIEVLSPSAISLVTLSPQIGITFENLSDHSSYTVIPVVDEPISIQTTPSSFCLFDRTHSGEAIKFGNTSYTSSPTSSTALIILLYTLLPIEKIFALTSSFLALIPIGDLIHSSRSTTK
jgi:hypothetical protein